MAKNKQMSDCGNIARLPNEIARLPNEIALRAPSGTCKQVASEVENTQSQTGQEMDMPTYENFGDYYFFILAIPGLFFFIFAVSIQLTVYR